MSRSLILRSADRAPHPPCVRAAADVAPQPGTGAPGPPRASITLDIRDVAPHSRLAMLQDAYRQIWGRVAITLPSTRTPPAHRLQSSRLGTLRFNVVRYSGLSFRREVSRTRDDAAPVYSLVFPQAGHGRVVLDDQSTGLSAGSFCLTNNWSAATLLTERAYESFSILLPRQMLDDRVKAGAARLHVSPRGDARAGMLAAYAAALHERIDLIPDRDAEFYANQLADLVAFALFERNALEASDSTVVAAHKRRVMDFIEHHYADERLDAARIAAACGISVRYLHRLFEGSDRSAMGHVWHVRLEHARRMLHDPLLRGKSVTEIAYRSGFCTASGFSCAFKRQFGLSPRDAR